MEDRIRTCLINSAHRGETISYSRLSEICDLGFDFSLSYHRSELGNMLGGISADEYYEERPLLSAIVVLASDPHSVGKGFYNLCESLEIGDAAYLQRINYLKTAQDDVFTFWQNPSNYATFK